MMMRMMLIMLILPKATLAWLEASGKGQLPRCLQLGTYTEIQQQYMYIFINTTFAVHILGKYQSQSLCISIDMETACLCAQL